MTANQGGVRLGLLSVWFGWCVFAAHSQPLAKPLGEFDKMVSELKAGSLMGEPVHAAGVTVIPFFGVQFSLAGAGGAPGLAGGMGTKTFPVGMIIVDGDEVKVEGLPDDAKKPSSAIQQLVQGILDRKVSFMVNGLNLGNAPGNIADLTPMIQSMMGQTSVVVNGLNLGNLKPAPNSGKKPNQP